MKDIENKAIKIGNILKDGKASDVMVFDLREKVSWADFFVIASVNSNAHSSGLYRDVTLSLEELELEIRPVKQKNTASDEWVLIDLGTIVVHLMSDTARKFYDLEKLWFGAKNITV